MRRYHKMCLKESSQKKKKKEKRKKEKGILYIWEIKNTIKTFIIKPNWKRDTQWQEEMLRTQWFEDSRRKEW